MHYGIDLFNQFVPKVKHGAIHVVVCMNTIITAEFAHPVMVQVSELCRHVEVGSPKEFPNEVVPGLFDISRHTDVFRPLLLRIEFAFPSGLAQNSEAVLSLRVVGELEVEKRVLETIGRRHFGLRG